jgi:hypothetical protein
MSGSIRRAVAAVALVLLPSMAAVAAPWAPVVHAAGAFTPLSSPQRLLDTRPGSSTADGAFAAQGIRPQGSTLELQVAGRAGVAAGSTAVVLNVTVDGAEQAGYVTAHPCDAPRPNASNLNYRIGQTIPNTVVTKLSAAGTVCLFTSGATHLIVDVSGVLAPDAFRALDAPQRLLETRSGLSTADGQFNGIGMRAAGDVIELPVAGRAGVSATATSVVLNVTVDDARADGFVTVYPCDAPRPNASNLNFVTGQTIPNAVITRIGAAGTVCLFTSGAAQMVVDIAGELAGGAFMPLAAPQRVLDTRSPNATADSLFSGAGLQPASSTLQLRIAGRVGVPGNASAVVLNVTAVDATSSGFVTAHPRGTARPNASNLNFVARQAIPNLVIAGIGPQGDVCLFTSGATQLVVDVAGWLTGPAPAATGTNCPSTFPAESTDEARAALLVRSPLVRAVGEDRIGIWVCDVPANSSNPSYSFNESVAVDENAVAAWAQANVSPYFAEVSRGRFSTTFTALGRIALAPTDGPNECLNRAIAATGSPYTNVLATDTRSYGGGFGGPGRISSSPSANGTVLDGLPPSTTARGLWVGGGSTGGTRLNPAVVIHEIGHSVHWPHSFRDGSFEYDNPVDVMSGRPVDGLCSAPSDGGGTVLWSCVAQHTLSFNRFAAGWVDGNQVAIQASGTVNYTLDSPGRDGVQMVALPDPVEPRSMLTLEARPRVGRDRFLGAEGVAIHVIDQVPRGGFGDGISTDRHQRQAIGAPDSYDHVIAVGGTVTVDGVTISVLSRIGDTYEVTVTGTYHMPGPEFFA